MLLAAIAVACLAPEAADAARRDERGRQQVSRPAAAQVVKASPTAKPAQAAARQAASQQRPAGARQAAAPARAVAAAPQRGAAARNAAMPQAQMAVGARTAMAVRGIAPSRHANLRAADLRGRGYSLVMRSASAATVSRDAVASCSRRNGRVVCAARDVDSVAGWQSGLPPVDYAQRDCPAGTFATLARGHDDVVRCMPI
jgi:hypothetical protein